MGWRIGRAEGVLGLVHEEGIFSDGAAGLFQSQLMPRLSHVYRFKNESSFPMWGM